MKKAAKRKFESGYEAGEHIPVLMTQADQQRIRDLESGVSDLLQGKHLTGIDDEIEMVRNDIARIEDLLSLIASKVGVVRPRRSK